MPKTLSLGRFDISLAVVMRQSDEPNLPIWIFVLGDISFIIVAIWLTQVSPAPITALHALMILVAVGAGAWCSIYPFLKAYQRASRVSETDKLKSTVETIEELKNLASSIDLARGDWQSAGAESQKVIDASKEVYDRMAEETKAFHQFLQDSQATEIRNLKLETDKLRKADQTWVELTVHLLDHIYAISTAAERSGQDNLSAQHVQFRAACYDIVRRVGLVPFGVEPGEIFDPRKHQIKNPEDKVGAGAKVEGTIATGYTYQGQLLRRSMVALDAPQEASELKEGSETQSEAAAPDTKTDVDSEPPAEENVSNIPSGETDDEGNELGLFK